MEAVMAPHTEVSRAYRKGQGMRDHLLYWSKSLSSSAVYSASFVYHGNF
jgi:hypothetical protein